jgi:hypothetical protein
MDKAKNAPKVSQSKAAADEVKGNQGAPKIEGPQAKAETSQDKPAQPKRQAQKRGDQTPEAKRSTKDQQDAANKLFADADRLAQMGLPETLTVEQREKQVRRAATGF